MKRAIHLIIIIGAAFALTPIQAASPADSDCPTVRIEPQRLPDLNVPRAGHSLLCIADEIIAFGGGTTGFVLTNTAEYYKDGKWHLMEMTYPHDEGIAVPQKSGKVLLAGSFEKNLGIGQTYEAEIYDPASHTFKGFGSLATKRCLAAATEIDSGEVVISGNWYHNDGIELYDGHREFGSVKATSTPRSRPHIFRIANNDVMIFGGQKPDLKEGDQLANPIVDRLRGEPFNVPLFEQWRPMGIMSTHRCADSFVGDEAKGYYAYLFPVVDSTGRVAIALAQDTIFSLLPTDSRIPMTFKGDTIYYNTQLFVDRQLHRGYLFGTNAESRRMFVLAIAYGQALGDKGSPAPVTLYYTDILEARCNGKCVLTPEGNLLVAGGNPINNFDVSRSVYLFPFGQQQAATESSNIMPWLWAALGLIAIAALIFLMVKNRQRRRQSDLQAPAPAATEALAYPNEPHSELLVRISQIMEAQQLYLNSKLRVSDVAQLLNVNQNEVSSCINSLKGCSFATFVNGYRIAHAKELLVKYPDKKLAHIAEESGFTNEQTFYTNFKSLAGMTPRLWVANMKESTKEM